MTKNLEFDSSAHVLQISVTVFKDGNVHQDAHQPTPVNLTDWSTQRAALIKARDSISRLIDTGPLVCPYSPANFYYPDAKSKDTD